MRVVEHELVAQIDTSLSASADFINRTLRSGSSLPTREGPTDLYVQFVAADGRVVGASTAAQHLPPLASAAPARGARFTTTHDATLGDLRVLARPSPIAGATTLVVARSAAGLTDVRDSLLRFLWVMVPAMSLLLGVLIWVVVGRALRPVDRMRRTVEAISEHDLHRRIETPGTRDELERLAGTLNELLQRLDHAVARERQFVADASHELRTPITSTRLLLESESLDPESVMHVRAEALARLGHLQDLVDDLLVLAKADETAPDALTTPVDLDELVLAQARQLERTTDLRIDVARVSGGQVAGRDTDLGRLVENLASNAARYASSTVGFTVAETNGDVEFRVSDDGPGIAAADRSRIFERFSTVDDEPSAGRRGAGLGLSIASAIVAAHQGTIHVEDTPGRGATFVVRLPAVAARAPASAPAELSSS
jgi:signal transduction histidine kinase